MLHFKWVFIIFLFSVRIVFANDAMVDTSVFSSWSIHYLTLSDQLKVISGNAKAEGPALYSGFQIEYELSPRGPALQTESENHNESDWVYSFAIAFGRASARTSGDINFESLQSDWFGAQYRGVKSYQLSSDLSFGVGGVVFYKQTQWSAESNIKLDLVTPLSVGALFVAKVIIDDRLRLIHSYGALFDNSNFWQLGFGYEF